MEENKFKYWIQPHSGLFVIDGGEYGVELVKEDLTAIVEIFQEYIIYYSSGHVEAKIKGNDLIITNLDMDMTVTLDEDEQIYLIANIVKLKDKTALYNDIVEGKYEPIKR